MSNPQDTGKSIDQVSLELKNAIHNIIPGKVRIVALAFFDDSFKNQGFGRGVEKWAPRKPVYRRGKQQGLGRAILIKKGRLRRSIRGTMANNMVIVSTDVPYAQVHNEGGRAGRKLAATIPKRQYMGNHAILTQDLETMILNEIKKAMA